MNAVDRVVGTISLAGMVIGILVALGALPSIDRLLETWVVIGVVGVLATWIFQKRGCASANGARRR